MKTSLSSSSSSCPSSPPFSSGVAGSCSPHDHLQGQEKKPGSKRSRKCREQCSDESRNSGTRKKSSIYRGVTRHRLSGKFEAHLWDKSWFNSSQNKKGRQGAYDSEEAAARTFDLASLKLWGHQTVLNFSTEDYQKEMEEMQSLSKVEYLTALRRRSGGFSRGVSKYRGVARHHYNGRWEARIGRVNGNKYLYLGIYGKFHKFLDVKLA
ncbi:hypothetical protein SAY87_006949 [Trapa incisa]|uniref:AP2/ERF domain-containing protein n=1 Tax=Trapa incisa TaxID=236973 RepID=A0AAN7K0G5_9MYRT|nr:hypothetical protein SAY87_006949 [Trapa incisa]